MYAKIQITGNVEVKTGMHIGGSSAFAAIGAVDSPIIRDEGTRLPMIPGSSFKGKMRTLLAKYFNTGDFKKIAATPDNDCEELIRLFGSAKKDNIRRSRVQIADMVLANEKELREKGVQNLTEIKFENTINRLTAVANPRQIERVIAGSIFNLDIVYEAEDETEIIDDIKTLATGLKLLHYDYIGGNGSRGYGKVIINNVEAKVVVGTVKDDILAEINKILQDNTNL